MLEVLQALCQNLNLFYDQQELEMQNVFGLAEELMVELVDFDLVVVGMNHLHFQMLVDPFSMEVVAVL
jgi:hypothetical protein